MPADTLETLGDIRLQHPIEQRHQTAEGEEEAAETPGDHGDGQLKAIGELAKQGYSDTKPAKLPSRGGACPHELAANGLDIRGILQARRSVCRSRDAVSAGGGEVGQGYTISEHLTGLIIG